MTPLFKKLGMGDSEKVQYRALSNGCRCQVIRNFKPLDWMVNAALEKRFGTGFESRLKYFGTESLFNRFCADKSPSYSVLKGEYVTLHHI